MAGNSSACPLHDSASQRQFLLDWRGVETPCVVCGGTGKRAYESTATWHGGIGGQMITVGVCNKCWGSGEADKPWPSWK